MKTPSKDQLTSEKVNYKSLKTNKPETGKVEISLTAKREEPSKSYYFIESLPTAKKRIPREARSMKSIQLVSHTGERKSFPIFKELEMEIPVSKQKILHVTTNDDDYETDEEQLANTEQFCRKQVLEGIEKEIAEGFFYGSEFESIMLNDDSANSFSPENNSPYSPSNF